MIDKSLAEKILNTYNTYLNEEKLLPESQLKQYLKTFKDKYGPEILKNLDGEMLLETMHDHSNRDSLVYWLEFKNDEELPTNQFGSIAGGSALKFGIYRRKGKGSWMTGSPQKQIEITVDDAIKYARKYRDQLIKGCELLEQLPVNASEEEYKKLQEDMDTFAPDVSNTSWGHKYFSMIYPDKLDDFHAPNFQRFYLYKLLLLPPEGDGRYIAAGYYISIAKQLNISVNNLTIVLYYLYGRPHRYWRIGTSDGNQPRNQWETMKSSNCVAIGWSDLGDLSNYDYNQEDKNKIKEKIKEMYYLDSPSLAGRKGTEVFRFVRVISEGDLVIASDGGQVIGIGKITGDYYFDPAYDFPHRRSVEWLSLEEWSLPKSEGLRTTVFEIKNPLNIVQIEKVVFNVTPPTLQKRPPEKLTGIPGRIQLILERKGQVIIYGPPGTGKTYWAEIAARNLAAKNVYGKWFSELSDEEKDVINGEGNKGGLVRLCTFHPAYGYEDFIEGYRSETVNGQLTFNLRDGIFKKLCEDAIKNKSKKYYLLIDEINRGDIPRIFGELITILEKDKREKSILLPLSGASFSVPDNIYIIGTMNTADRSIALLDTALRRRFGFVELMPDSSVLGDKVIDGIPLAPWMEELNKRICEHVGRDARNLQIGHSFFLEKGKPVSDFSKFSRIIQEDIIPLLEEYCYEDYDALEKVLGKGLVDQANQRIRHELFEVTQQDALKQALLAPSPDIATTQQAVTSIEDVSEDEDGDENYDSESETVS